MKPFPAVPLLALCAVSLFAADAPKEKADAKPAKGGGFVFSLLPKSLQKNPRLDFNILTEMTPAGQRAPQPTAGHPVYYVAAAGKMVNNGIGAENQKGPPRDQVERLMTKALAERGYVVTEGNPLPTIAVVYNWGTSSFQPPVDVSDGDPDAVPMISEVEIRKGLLDRAQLIGGQKFVKEVADAMQQVDIKASMSNMAVPEGGDFMGSVGDMMPDPFERLRSRNVEMERLVDELFSSSYFVVASAYDYAAMAKGQRVLLWRTKMTVNSLGVNMAESVPPLIASASPYLGVETKDPIVVTKRISREGHVEVGTPVVVPDKPKK